MPRLGAYGSASYRAFRPGAPPLPLVVGAAPASVSGTRTEAGTGVTSSTTVTVSGGVAPYTYSWSCTNSFAATSPAAATTTFSRSLGMSETQNGVATCTITDAAGTVAVANTVNLTVNSVLASLFITIADIGPTSKPSGSSFVVSLSYTVFTGGTPPYTQSWTASAGSLSNASVASPTWTRTSQPPGTHDSFSDSVFVTDSIGRTGADTGTIKVDWT